MFSFKINGLEDLLRNLDVLEEQLIEAVEDAVDKTCVEILADSKMLVPVLTGQLKNSGHTTNAENKNNVIEGKVVYDKNYSMRQHELHKTANKFLEKPLFDNAQQLNKNLTDELNKVIK